MRIKSVKPTHLRGCRAITKILSDEAGPASLVCAGLYLVG